MNELENLNTTNNRDCCPVCYDEIDNIEPTLNCNHYVHKKCIIKAGVAICPLCRTPVTTLTKTEKRKLKKVATKFKQQAIKEEQDEIINNELTRLLGDLPGFHRLDETKTLLNKIFSTEEERTHLPDLLITCLQMDDRSYKLLKAVLPYADNGLFAY